MTTRSLFSPLIASVLLFVSVLSFTGCATMSALSSPLAQGAFNTAAETATGTILAKDPSQVPALTSLAAALPTAFKGSLTSENIGAMLKTIGGAAGAASSTTIALGATLDGAVRNYVKQNGGDVPTLQGAIVQQILTNFADGMSHGIALYQASK